MLQFIYNLINSQYFGILILIWALICVAWVTRWRALFGRIGELIVKPWIFKKDPKPDIPPLYPRDFLEDLANSTKRPRNTSEPVGTLSKWSRAQRDHLFDEKRPLRPIGYMIFLIVFIIFVLADAISVANTLEVLGVITSQLPDIFQRFDLAVFGGALLATIIGLVVFSEVQGVQSEFTSYGELSKAQKSTIKGISVFVVVFSIVVMVAFAIYRLIIIGTLETNSTVDILLNSILFGLVPINSALGAAISFPEAVRGVIVLLILISSLIVSIVPAIAFFVDLLWRLFYIIIDLILWFVFTPILAIPVGIKTLWVSVSD